MFVNYFGSLNSDENFRGFLNELEDMVMSFRFFFVDIWDSISVEVSNEIVFIKI